MTPELTLLRVLLDKPAFNKYFQYVDVKGFKDTYKEVYHLYTTLEDLHEQTPDSLSLNDLKAFFFLKFPHADKSVYDLLFEQLETVALSEGVPEALLEDLKLRKVALTLSEKTFQLSQGTGSLEEVYELVNSITSVPGSHSGGPKRVTTNLSELLEHTYKAEGLRWPLNCLNKSLGSLRDGDFGFIFARPETGKTTFLAAIVANFLRQATRPVMWFNNEEQGEKVVLRVYQAYFKVTLAQLMGNINYYETTFNEETKGLLQFYDSATISKREVESLVKEHNPAIVVYDQLPKIKGFQADRDDLRLGAIFQWARELAKGSHAAIGVSQADGTAEGVRYLTMEHVANAKTAVQAEADWILGIGKVHDEALQQVRYLNISKNKLFGDQDSDPGLKHGRFEVLINPLIAQYEDIIQYK